MREQIGGKYLRGQGGTFSQSLRKFLKLVLYSGLFRIKGFCSCLEVGVFLVLVGYYVFRCQKCKCLRIIVESFLEQVVWQRVGRVGIVADSFVELICVGVDKERFVFKGQFLLRGIKFWFFLIRSFWKELGQEVFVLVKRSQNFKEISRRVVKELNKKKKGQ